MSLLEIAEKLHQSFRELREAHHFNENFRLRIHRSISWLKKSATTDDLDIQFISLWISFNAAYAKELEDGKAIDKTTFINFIHTICNLDKDNILQQAIWETLPQNITQLLNNRYTYQPFWQYHNGYTTESYWKNMFLKENSKALNAIQNKNTRTLLIIAFGHLYTLRNQLIHGGSTHNSGVNREQLQDSCKILSTLIPIIIEIMMNNPKEVDWGKAFYPVVKD